jgi:hypothetical protein
MRRKRIISSQLATRRQKADKSRQFLLSQAFGRFDPWASEKGRDGETGSSCPLHAGDRVNATFRHI